MRDGVTPLHLFQLGAESFAPVLGGDVQPGNLSPSLSSFVGRRAELDTVTNLVGSQRLVSLTGVGTTRGLHRLGARSFSQPPLSQAWTRRLKAHSSPMKTLSVCAVIW